MAGLGSTFGMPFTDSGVTAVLRKTAPARRPQRGNCSLKPSSLLGVLTTCAVGSTPRNPVVAVSPIPLANRGGGGFLLT
jgi:hypothetical protein